MLFTGTFLSTPLLLSFLAKVTQIKATNHYSCPTFFIGMIKMCENFMITFILHHCATQLVMSVCLLLSFHKHLTSHLFHAFVTEKF